MGRADRDERARRAWELLERLGNLLRAEERRLLADEGLQPVHLHALAFLARANRYSDTPGAVAEYLGTTKGTTSKTLGVLADRGLLAAAADERDGRLTHLSPTAAGKRLLARALPPPGMREALASPDLERGGGLPWMEELLRSLQRANGSRAFGVCRTCRHLRSERGATSCGLTGEPLSAEETQRVCREHETAG